MKERKKKGEKGEDKIWRKDITKTGGTVKERNEKENDLEANN